MRCREFVYELYETFSGLKCVEVCASPYMQYHSPTVGPTNHTELPHPKFYDTTAKHSVLCAVYTHVIQHHVTVSCALVLSTLCWFDPKQTVP
jgi:hypothetical protein